MTNKWVVGAKKRTPKFRQDKNAELQIGLYLIFLV
jgi:hypothetical protein